VNIPANSWMVRLFDWTNRRIREFRGRDPILYDAPEKTDLCTFARTLVVYLPLLILSQVVFIAAPIVTLYYLPVSFFGSDWWMVIAWVIGMVVFGSAVVGFFWWLDHTPSNSNSGESKPYKPGPLAMAINVAGEYMKAHKEQYCPIITIQDRDHSLDRYKGWD